MGKTVENDGKKRQGKKRVAEVITCPAEFPDFRSFGELNRPDSHNKKRRRNVVPEERHREGGPRNRPKAQEIDFEDAVREVHAFGSKAFTGRKAKQHRAAEYGALTGREMKREKVPPNIARALRKKREEREVRAEAEARESGVVTGSSGGIGGDLGKSGGEGRKGGARDILRKVGTLAASTGQHQM